MLKDCMQKFAAFCFKGLSSFLWYLPRSVLLFIGDVLGWLWFSVVRIRRNVALNNLRLAFPEWTEVQRKRIALLSLQNLGRSLPEYFLIPCLNLRRVTAGFTCHNLHYLEEAIKKEKGTMILTLHLGNGDYAISALSVMGFPMNLITKEFRWRWLNELWFAMRKGIGTKLIGPRRSHYDILKALRGNEVVVFVLDQHMGPPLGVKTRFFGHNVGTALGLATIASRTKSHVIPAFTVRKADGKMEMHFFPEIPFTEAAELERTLAEMTQRYTDELEKFVRLYPEQWMWIHKRWKGFRET